MKNILYIGNQLSNKTATTIETLSALLRSEGFSVTTASNKKNKILRLWDMLFHIIKYRKSTDYVLIDTYSTTNFYYAYLCSMMCQLFKLKYIPILHGGNLPERLKTSPQLSKQIFKNAHINVSPSKFLMLSFQKSGFKNIIHIPNTIELKHYNFKERDLDEIHLLWVRSFSNIYNPKLAVEILKSLKLDNIKASLCMVGPDNDGSLSETKRLANDLGIEVEFTGKLSKPEWHKKAEKFNVFINTTTVDNMPVSVIEAMALGLPVVTTNVGGLPYLIENNVDGILVESNNVIEFKKAILKLKKDVVFLSQITNRARQKAEQFDWNTVKHQWFSILS
ncbi:Glycosyltransferase involved in cell wall bisynthesis [Hyunsoonleella jejuensis]|uniref:Glycosyltransferase involved in cell wall bisynthesis n=1 Tax=Hyunsoonleella jejuensis TaxID=419940 RepID=A0A1H9D9T4_9FLAO|nr:glycosyltransferase family 4 protein [Hyunsoonleella jejuensis]SEQ10245.1 Glycosyltransferase involved in cell wall bisynthesis [Hyunsoonleella jejuensis]